MSREKKIDDVSTVVDAALEIIEECGYSKLSTRNISAKLKVSPMTLYNYYENRNAILKDVVNKGFDELWIGLREKLESHGAASNPLSEYLILADHMLDFGMARPNLYRFLFRSAITPLIADKNIADRFRDIGNLLIPRVNDESKRQDVFNDIYMFLVLMNSLVNNVLDSRIEMTVERYRTLIRRSYDSLLLRDEQYIR